MGQVVSGERVLVPADVPSEIEGGPSVVPFGDGPFAYRAYGAQLSTARADEPDPHWYHFGPSLHLPRKIDLRIQRLQPYPTILDQGSLGACTAFAATGAIECTSRRDSQFPLWELSPLYNYVETLWASNPVSPLVDTGSTIGAAMESAMITGVASRTAWPLPKAPSEWNRIPPDTVQHPFRVRTLGHLEQNLTQLRTALAAGYAVAFSFAVTHQGNEWMKTMMLQHPSFIYPVERELVDLKEIVGAHAVVLVGYDDDSQLFIIRNSWGPEWGNHGHFFMTYSMVVMRFWCRDFYIALKVARE